MLSARLVAACGVAFVVDVLATAHLLAVPTGRLGLAVGSVVLLQLSSLLGQHWFIEADGWRERVVIASAIALGTGLGTTFVMLVF